MSALLFADLGLDGELVANLDSLGIREPSPIQAQAIPPALAGRDLVGLSQTGSGKTAAFGMPLIQKLNPTFKKAQALVICPTRELAVQVGKALADFAKPLGSVRIATLYGGAAMDRQVSDLKRGAQIVVGTPGRIADHMRRGTFKADEVRFVVLDEADRMLDMGFRDEMVDLLKPLPEDRQTLFFSATMNKDVARLIERFSNEPEWIEVKQAAKTADTVEQSYFDLRWPSKAEVICRLLEMDTPRLAIVFCNTKKTVDECVETLQGQGFPADRIHGDMTQPMRERVLGRFRNGQISILIATDVAARGLDIDDVDLVINFDLPADPEDYVHRIGRTGRAGRSGRAVSLVARRETERLRRIERFAKLRIHEKPIPGRKELELGRGKQMLETLHAHLTSEDEDASISPEFSALGENFAWEEVASTLFELWCGTSMREIQPIPEDNPRQQRSERPRRDDRSDREPRHSRSDDQRDRRGRDRGREDGGDRRGNRDRDERGERGGNRDRDRRRDDARPTETPPPPEGKRRVFIGLGRVEKIRPGELIGMLYNESKIPDGAIGQLHLFPRHSLVDVDDEYAQALVKCGKSARYRGRAFRIRFDERS